MRLVTPVRDRGGPKDAATAGSPAHEPRRRRGEAAADRIFISYRRADSGGWARSLHDNIDERLGKGRAFRDVAMEGGMDFHEHVESLLDHCDVLLAVIGRHWASITDADGNRRLDDPEDLVRREIARALERPDVEVIPVLVDGARMPAEHELPPDLAALSRRQACELSDTRWDYDVECLTKRLCVLLGEKRRRTWPGARLAVSGALAAIAGVFLMLWPSLNPDDAPPTRTARLSNATLDRPVTFGQYLDRIGFSKQQYPRAQLERPGALVTFDYRIQGYRGKRLPLRWELLDASTGDQLGHDEAVSIMPEADTDQASWPVWVPLPPGRRRVFVQLQLYDPGGIVPVGRIRTGRFVTPRDEAAAG